MQKHQFLGELFYADNRHLTVQTLFKVEYLSISCMEAVQTDLNRSLTMSDLCWRNARTT